MPKQLDLVLVHPGGHEHFYTCDKGLGFRKSGFTAKEPPIWAGMMATYARKKGYSVQIVEANLDDLTPEQTAERIIEMDPRLTAFVLYGHQPSASTQTMVPIREETEALKQLALDQKILLVGGHVAALPERTLREETSADFTCAGEGPATVTGLLEALATKDPKELLKVPDLYFRDNGRICRSPARARLIQNLDEELPGIAWDLLPPISRYRTHEWHSWGGLPRSPYAAFYTTLGCPFKCSFCCIQAPFKSGEAAIGMKPSVNSYRFWNPETVEKWFEYLVEQQGVTNIKVADEMFVLNPRHVMELCDIFIKRGWGKRLNIWAYSRVDTCRPEFLEKLRLAGFRWLILGIEAADANVRKNVDKGKFGEATIYDVVKQVQAADIKIQGNYMFGLPEDTKETMQATLDMAINLPTEYVNFYCTLGYPGTGLYEDAKRYDWPLPDDPGGPGWVGYAHQAYEYLPLPSRHLPAGEIIWFRDQAYKAWHSDPNVLARTEKTFGKATAEHVRELGQREFRRLYYPK